MSSVALRTVEAIAGRIANPDATIGIPALLPKRYRTSLNHDLEEAPVLDVGAVAR